MKNLKLDTLELKCINSKEADMLKGGQHVGGCGCGCKYEGEPGGSTTEANMAANDEKRIPFSPGVPLEDQTYTDTIDPAIIYG